MLQSSAERRDGRVASTAWLGGTCELSSVTLVPPPALPHLPARAELTLRVFARTGAVSEHRIQLAEAHWATVFPVPGYSEFLNWVTARLPLILQAHLGWGLYQARATESTHAFTRLVRVMDTAGWYSLALILPVFPVITLAMLVVSLPLAFAPFESVRALGRQVQGIVANVLGDIYILLERPSRAAAIRERIRGSYAALAASCDRVIVVAHSQGAAVALDYLVEERPAKIVRLVTLGSGARKLAHLRLARLGSKAYGTSSSAWIAVGTPLFIGLLLSDLSRGQRPSWFSLGFIAVMVICYLVTRWLHGSSDQLQHSSEWKRILTSLEIPWNDIYARADPVSNGKHVVAKDGNARPHEIHATEVQNRGSVLSDHTTYWENTTQFVPRVAAIISREAGFDIEALTPADRPTLQYAWFARGFRVSSLRLGRTAVWLALLHVLLQGRQPLVAMGREAMRNGARLSDWLPTWVGTVVNWILGFNFGRGPDWMAGALLVIGLAFVVQSIWLRAWKWIDEWAETRMFNRGADSTLVKAELSPDLLLFGYGIFLLVSSTRTLFTYVPAPPFYSFETLLATFLLVLNLTDIANCLRFAWQEVRPKQRRRR